MLIERPQKASKDANIVCVHIPAIVYCQIYLSLINYH